MNEQPRFGRRLLDCRAPSADLCHHPGDTSHRFHPCISVVLSGLQRRGAWCAFSLFPQAVRSYPQCPGALREHGHLELIAPLD